MNIIKKIVFIEKNNLAEYERDYQKILNFKNKLNNEGFINVIKDYDYVLPAIKILEKYGYFSMLKYSLTLDEISDILNFIYKNSSIGLQIYTKGLIKIINHKIKMNGLYFEDPYSYLDLVGTFANKSFIQIIDNDRLQRRKNGVKYNIEDYYFTNNFIEKPSDNLNMVVNYAANKLNKRIKYIDNLNKLLLEIDDLNPKENNEDFSFMVDRYCKLLKNNSEFVDKTHDEVKIYLKKIVKENSNKQYIQQNQNNNYDCKFQKFGTRVERKRQYEKNQMISNLNELNKKLTNESKLWVDLLVEQLLEFDEKSINDFINNPNDYVLLKDEEQFDLIILTTSLKLEYKDADERLVTALNKTIGR